MKLFILCIVVLLWAMLVAFMGMLTMEAIHTGIKQDLLYNDFIKHL